jgi:hypothetical protein
MGQGEQYFCCYMEQAGKVTVCYQEWQINHQRALLLLFLLPGAESFSSGNSVTLTGLLIWQRLRKL